MSKAIISTEKAPKAIGPYSQAVKAGNLVMTSGQLPMDPETGEMPEGIEKQAEQSLNNLRAIVEEAGGSFDSIIKTLVFLQDMKDFVKFNKVYSGFFQENPPARSCVEVARLPKDALVEIEAIAII